jgi:glucuronoarabinoxylan endo-1,4-beta-xylanase
MSVKRLYTYLFFISALVWSPCYGDAIAPKPATMKWLVVPATTGPYSITMTAVTALDAGNDYPVQYYFECINHGEANSTWQSSPTYEATGLTPGTMYTFKARARDSVGNMTGWTSNTLSATTDATSTPPVLRLDLNNSANNNDADTQTGFLPFIIENSGSEINGVAIDLGGNITSANRDDPRGVWVKYDTGGSIPGDPCYYSPRAGERIYRDFIYGIQPSGVTITLWGLGVNRDCNITIWAYDSQTGESRTAKWYSNGTYIFDTNFTGGAENWPLYDNYPGGAADLYKYAFKGRATTDNLGRIVLTSSKDPCSPAGQDFAFVNAIKVEPNWSSTFVPTKYAYHPVPFDSAEGVPIDVILEWKKGVYAEKHDVYFGTDEAKVTDANRSNPLGVLVSQNHSTTTYNPPEFLDLNTTYYWRIDEVNAAPDYTIFKGEVWSFKTLPYFVVEDFDSYEDDSALRNVWDDGSTSAEVSVETAIVRDGNSMRYRYKNNLPPYYSEAYVDIADLGIDDPDWLGTGAKTLVLYFYGEPTNPIGEQMYVKLTDGDSPAKTATVMYGNMNDVRLKQWNKWSIVLTEFTGVNLANVASITIGFGDGSSGNAGTVYFEDITLGAEVEVLPAAAGVVDISTVYQQLEGFGGAVVYDSGSLTTHQKKEEIYDLLFKELGLEILRIRNTYGYTTEPLWQEMTSTAEIVAEARKPGRSPNIKTELVPWSPPAYLKSNNSESNGGTLKKDAYGNFIYDDYAQWWYESLLEFAALGVEPDFISIQNEPLIETSYDSCRFYPNEWWDPCVAGYDYAFETVWQKLNAEMGSAMPEMWAPETMGLMDMEWYILYSFDPMYGGVGDISHVAGFSHHLYTEGDYDDPDGMIDDLSNAYDNFGYKPLHMTEYVKLDTTPNFDMGMKFAWHIYNCLYYLHSTSYFNWTLFRSSSAGGIVTIDSTSAYTIRPQYWFLKAYTHFTGKDWYVLGTSVSGTGSSNVRISAFKSPENDQQTVVILNKSANSTNLTLTLNGFSLDNAEIYRSGETEHWVYIGPFYEAGSLMLPAYSITTISNVALSNCDSVLAADHGLTSDIYPDCYVNYKDLKIITDYWLNTECDLYGGCEGADFEPTNGIVNFFDLSTFAEQWLWCNNPEDAGCTPNW